MSSRLKKIITSDSENDSPSLTRNESSDKNTESDLSTSFKNVDDTVTTSEEEAEETRQRERNVYQKIGFKFYKLN